MDDLLTHRVASRFKNANMDGPYMWTDQRGIQVWIAMDSYGRVHHVTGDLKQAEKLLDRHRTALVHAQRDLIAQGISIRDIGDIYVDGLQGGRNRMILQFYARAQGDWDEEAQNAVSATMGRLKFKSPPNQ